MSDYSLNVSWSQTGPSDSIRINVSVKLESSNSQTKGKIYIGLFQDTVFMESKNGEENPPHVFRGGSMEISDLSLPTIVGNTETFELVLAPLSDLEDASLYAAAVLYDEMGSYEQAARSTSHTSLPTHLATDFDQSFSIYPNPSQNAVYHNLNTDIQVNIMDYTGKSHYEGIWKKSSALSAKLEPGIYLVQVALDGHVRIQRLLIYP